MADGDSLSIRRAAGAVLRVLKRRGAPPQRPGGWGQSEPLRPALAIDALLTGMGARFGLAESAVNGLLRPALADWRDAVGCADPLLVPANAQGPAAGKALLPLPMPSWCAWLIDAGVLLLEGPPPLDGPRVVQRAWPAGWPRWAVLRVLEGREPQALWDLPAIWQACTKDAPEAGVSAAASPVPGTLRLAVDIGSTSTVAVEEDNAAGGSIGAKLLPQGAPRPSPSGFPPI